MYFEDETTDQLLNKIKYLPKIFVTVYACQQVAVATFRVVVPFHVFLLQRFATCAAREHYHAWHG